LQCSSGRSEEEEKLLAGRTASQKLLEAGKHHQRKAHWRKISGRIIIPLVSAQEQILAIFARRKAVP
jgi:Ribonuclease G/E